MDAIILVVHVMVSLLLVGLILIQHGKGADAGAAALGGGGGGGGGASSSLFGSQGSASFLSRTSAILAAVFFATSLSLAYFSGKAERIESVTQQAVTTTVTDPVESLPADLPEIP
ncbi:preprotein translocase subunit SecG [Methylophaga sp. 42_25_T18]|nr:preprotein translocase subunit SecG [Methylophaga sp. 42_25_T18]OUR86816.1 preprotein translocase subunit SecG [Methylophaga sp. 42_8_T64]